MTANYPKQRPDLFWLVVGLIVLASFLSSCSNDFYCSRCVTHDSTVVKTIYIPKDSTILVPRDSFAIHFLDSVPCADVEINGSDNKGNRATLKVKDNKATIVCDCTEYKARISWMEKQTTTDHTLTRYVTTRKKSNWWIWLLVGIGVGYLGPKILNLTGV
jgi:PKD repeat protein